jgi:hypothetical protein
MKAIDSTSLNLYFVLAVPEEVSSYGLSPALIAGIVVPVLLIFGCTFFFLLRYIGRLKMQIRNLTEEEIRDFMYGNENFDPNDLHAPIASIPFDQTLEIPREWIVLGNSTFRIL